MTESCALMGEFKFQVEVMSSEVSIPTTTVVAVAVVLCATMLKSFLRPSFLDCTKGSLKP